MKIIRMNTFETNSSSTHSLTMCMKETYDNWKAGNLFYLDGEFYSEQERKGFIKRNIIDSLMDTESERQEDDDGNFKCYIYHYTYKGITYDEREKHYTKENLDEITEEMMNNALENGDIYWNEIPMSYDEYCNWLDYEDFYQEFKTSNNETVVGFGYYGYDG